MTVTVLGMGNPILSDDAVGILVARRLASLVEPDTDIEVREVETGGMNLLDELAGCDAVVIVDAVITGNDPPGTTRFISTVGLPYSPRLRSAHDATLDAILALGRELGVDVPRETRVLAIEVADQPGGLAGLLGVFGEAGVNVEYMYAFSSNRAILVFRFADIDAAISALTHAGINPVSPIDLYDHLEEA